MSTREQTQAIVERIKAGEDGLMPELWDSIERLVAWYARRVAPILPPAAGLTFEDLYNSGYIALVDAVEHYDTDKGDFVTLFIFCLKNAFAAAPGTRRSKDPLRSPQTRSLNEPLGSEDDDYTLGDTVADQRNDIEDTEHLVFVEQLHNELEAAMNCLDDIGAATIRSRFYDGRTQKEVSEALGVSPSDAQQIEAKALKKLRSPKVLRSLRQYIEENTPYYMHVGVNRFNSTGSSAPEAITIMREQMAQRCTQSV